jgi:hypothetical protein
MNDTKESKIIPLLLGTFLALNIIATSISLIASAKNEKGGCGCGGKEKT